MHNSQFFINLAYKSEENAYKIQRYGEVSRHQRICGI